MKRLHKTMNRIVGVLLMALMMVPSGLKAETAEMLQTSKITGVVIDDFGEPIRCYCSCEECTEWRCNRC